MISYLQQKIGVNPTASNQEVAKHSWPIRVKDTQITATFKARGNQEDMLFMTPAANVREQSKAHTHTHACTHTQNNVLVAYMISAEPAPRIYCHRHCSSDGSLVDDQATCLPRKQLVKGEDVLRHNIISRLSLKPKVDTDRLAGKAKLRVRPHAALGAGARPGVKIQRLCLYRNDER